MSHVIRWDSSWLRWPDQCRMISVSVAYRPGRVLELTISIEVWLHPWLLCARKCVRNRADMTMLDLGYDMCLSSEEFEAR